MRRRYPVPAIFDVAEPDLGDRSQFGDPGAAGLCLPAHDGRRVQRDQWDAEPNNPFAAAGQVARLVGQLPNSFESTSTRSRVYRAAFGINGTILNDVDYRFDATAMHTDLRLEQNGYVYIQHLLDVIKDGSYNFINPGQNSRRR